MADDIDPLEFTEDELQTLESQHGEIAQLRNRRKGWAIALREPNSGEADMFRSNVNNPSRRAGAQEAMGRACTVAVLYNGERALDVKQARILLSKVQLKDKLLFDSPASQSVFERMLFSAEEVTEK